MKFKTILLASSLLLMSSINVWAEPGVVTILSPADHAVIPANQTNTLTYDVTPGTGGDHFHVWVDSDRGPAIHKFRGAYDLPPMSPGKHTITLKVVDSGHVPTGPEKSIEVTAK
jgi:hypothetical protein